MASRTDVMHRRARVAQLLLARATQPDIARQVGVNLMTIVKDEVAIRQEWTKERARAYERYLAEDLQRLGALERALWLPAMQGNLGAIDRILDIINQRSRLLGLEAPSRTEVTVLTEETVDAAIRRLEGELGHAEHHRGPVIETLALEAATGSQGPEQHGNGPVAPST